MRRNIAAATTAAPASAATASKPTGTPESGLPAVGDTWSTVLGVPAARAVSVGRTPGSDVLAGTCGALDRAARVVGELSSPEVVVTGGCVATTGELV